MNDVKPNVLVKDRHRHAVTLATSALEVLSPPYQAYLAVRKIFKF